MTRLDQLAVSNDACRRKKKESICLLVCSSLHPCLYVPMLSLAVSSFQDFIARKGPRTSTSTAPGKEE